MTRSQVRSPGCPRAYTGPQASLPAWLRQSGAIFLCVLKTNVANWSALKIPQPVDKSMVFPAYGVQSLLENVLRRFDSLQISTVFRR